MRKYLEGHDGVDNGGNGDPSGGGRGGRGRGRWRGFARGDDRGRGGRGRGGGRGGGPPHPPPDDSDSGSDDGKQEKALFVKNKLNKFFFSDFGDPPCPAGPRPRSNTGNHQAAPSNLPSAEARCKCSVPAAERAVVKESTNKGRRFRTCGHNGQCDFFEWTDGPSGATASGSSSSTIPIKRTFAERSVSRTITQAEATPSLFAYTSTKSLQERAELLPNCVNAR